MDETVVVEQAPIISGDVKFSDKRELFKRQLDFYDPEIVQKTPITIIGAGGLGSLAALMARKSGFTGFDLYDEDNLEPHNVSNQMFSEKHLGLPKVAGLKEEIISWMPSTDLPVNVTAFNQFFESNSILRTPVLIVAVDSMEARQKIYESWKLSDDCRILVDLRMGAYNNQVHLVDRIDDRSIKAYEPSLVAGIDALPCTGRSLFCVGAVCAAQGVLLLINYLRDAVSKEQAWDGPWSFHHDSQNYLYYGKQE